MITPVGQFTARTLRDAMRIAAQLNDHARMKLDATGIHIRSAARDGTTIAWIDIPKATFEAVNYHPEDPIFADDIDINCDKLCRALYAYESDDPIHFSLEEQDGTNYTTICGTEGTLHVPRPGLVHIDRIISLNCIQARHPSVVSGDIGAGFFRGWLYRIKDNETKVSFCYEKGSGIFPIKTVSEHTGLLPVVAVLSHPKVPENADSLQTCITLDLLQGAIAPRCIDHDILFSFGDDTPLYVGTQVNGCDVAMAIAPRIEAI